MREHAFCLGQAAGALGGDARAVWLTYELEQLLQPHLRLQHKSGLGGGDAILRWTEGPRGRALSVGLQCYRLEFDGSALPLVHVVAPDPPPYTAGVFEFWAVRAADYLPLYRVIRSIERQMARAEAPIMRRDDRERLFNNTVGFLRHGQRLLARYGVPRKRGILLTGEPGNGKTMACRWLMAQCRKRGLLWRSVSPQDYSAACTAAEMQALFALEEPGVILFDDFDHALRSRGAGPSTDRTTFLTQLDGVRPQSGVVYLFTSNAKTSDLDPAFRRPGRIDVCVHFPRPRRSLRRRLIRRTWHLDIVSAIHVEQVVAATRGLSFAEIEELKNLLVLGRLETGRWDWNAARRTFTQARPQAQSKPIGFHAHLSAASAVSPIEVGPCAAQAGRPDSALPASCS